MPKPWSTFLAQQQRKCYKCKGTSLHIELTLCVSSSSQNFQAFHSLFLLLFQYILITFQLFNLFFFFFQRKKNLKSTLPIWWWLKTNKTIPRDGWKVQLHNFTRKWHSMYAFEEVKHLLNLKASITYQW